MVTDPVCGMSLKPYIASANIQYAGRTYYFCSKLCQLVFEREPEKYIPLAAGQASMIEAIDE